MTNAVIIGCGYVGQAVAKRWQSTLTVTATTTTPERVDELASLADRVVVLKGTDRDGVRSLLQNQTVVLLSVGAPAGTPEAYEATYLATAKTLADVLPDTTVQQVIYTGSYAIYGDHQGVWVNEETAIAPANRNGEILAATEQVLLSARGPFKVCVFRLGGIYGPGRELVKIYRRAAGTTRPGTGQERANWVHLDDIVGAIDFARQQQLHGLYNLVDSSPARTGELIERVCRDHNLPPVTWDPSLPSNRPCNAQVSNQKLRFTGYQFIHPEIRETG